MSSKPPNSFSWDRSPPKRLAHSSVKHALLRQYLRDYLNILTNVPRRTELRLTLFDGFAGGGVFEDSGQIVHGTPLIMAEEVVRAHEIKSRERNIAFDIDLWACEKNPINFQSLFEALQPYATTGAFPGRVHLRNGDYSVALIEAIQNMQRIRNTSGRSIFLFDQTGFSQVNLDHIKYIFQTFRSPEVILTFSVSWLVDLSKNDPTFLKKVAPLGIGEAELAELLKSKEGWAPRYAGQKWIRKYIKEYIGAEFDTCFFLKSRPAGKDLWLLHFARSWRARDAMIDVHYKFSNEAHFYGKAGFEMLGFDPRIDPDQAKLFEFSSLDARLSVESLMNDVPKSLRDSGHAGGIKLIDLFSREVNDATLTFDMFAKGIVQARDQSIVEIRNKEGQVRPAARWLDKEDFVLIPDQKSFWHFLA